MRFLVVALIAVGIVASSSVARADKRVAFVVGNGAYRNVATLPNPPADAAAMAGTLRNVGFDVVEGINLTRDGMTEKLLDFGRRTQDADIALFYYAGHGIAINGVNYLLPVDADIKSEMDVKLGAAINVDVTLDQTMADANLQSAAEEPESHPTRHHAGGGGGHRYYRSSGSGGGGGGGGFPLFGGLMGGLFGRH